MSERIVPQDFYVYVHRKATTGEVFYVGKGTGKRAWAISRRSPHWNNIVAKHGFCVEIAMDGLQEWSAFELEVDLISLHGRKDLGLGELVNFSDGGEGGSGIVFTKERRDKLRDANTGKPLSEETRIKISLSLKGRSLSDKHLAAVRAAICKPRSEEVKEKIKLALSRPDVKEKHRIAVSLAKKGKPRSAKQKALLESPEGRAKHRLAAGAKPILCIETGQIFDTSCCAEKWLRQTKPKALCCAVLAACKGRAKSAYGYTWRYA